jgi:hypothetical protein
MEYYQIQVVLIWIKAIVAHAYSKIIRIKSCNRIYISASESDLQRTWVQF